MFFYETLWLFKINIGLQKIGFVLLTKILEEIEIGMKRTLFSMAIENKW